MNERILGMPRLGETMEEGKLVGWLIAPGERFKRGDPILEIETDKTIAEFPALGDGRLIEPLVSIGDVVEVGAALARIEIADGPDWTQAEAAEAPAAVPAIASSADTAVPAPAPQARRVRATPVARRLAHQHALEIAAIAGSGRRGRVEKADVLAAAGSSDSAPERDGLCFAALRRGRMAYTDTGAAFARPVLLLHGFAGDHTTWAALAAGLKRARRRVIAPDLPGHGQTEIAAHNGADLALDLPELLDALGIAEAEVVAHSLGAVAALDLALAAPHRVSSLTLIAPAGLGPEMDTGFVRGMAHAATPGEVTHLLRRLSLNPVELSDAALSALAQALSKGRLLALADAIAGDFGQKLDTLAALGRLAGTLPIRVLFGLEDRIIPWTQVRMLPPAVAIHLLARSGHLPQWDQSQDVLDILAA